MTSKIIPEAVWPHEVEKRCRMGLFDKFKSKEEKAKEAVEAKAAEAKEAAEAKAAEVKAAAEAKAADAKAREEAFLNSGWIPWPSDRIPDRPHRPGYRSPGAR